eukprot:314074-Rhodomonas_salina.1
METAVHFRPAAVATSGSPGATRSCRASTPMSWYAGPRPRLVRVLAHGSSCGVFSTGSGQRSHSTAHSNGVV